VATHIRGALVINSLTTLRSANRLDDYFACLPTRHHGDVNAVTVQSWVPMDLALVHYAALGDVFVDVAEQIKNGRLAAERTQNVHLRTVLRVLSATGTFDVWDGLARIPSFVARSFQGGQFIVRRIGPKDARLEFVGFPLFRVSYMHNSFPGTYQAALELVSPRIFVRQDLSFRTESSMALLVSWV
jgi:hypothetical protein